MDGPTVIIGVDYDEYQPDTYRAVTLTIDDGEPHRFASGDPDADYQAALATLRGTGATVMESSTVHNFTADRKRAAEEPEVTRWH